jgi:hypothetical protein
VIVVVLVLAWHGLRHAGMVARAFP